MERFDIALPARGGSMHGLTWGPSDRPVDVVFLHANGFNALTYRSILAPLGEGLRIVALDQRGHGRTRLPTVTEGRPDWLDLRDDLLAALEEMNVENAILAGHSMGGTVSILAASAEPRRAQSLVVFDPVITQRPLGMRCRPHPWSKRRDVGGLTSTARTRPSLPIRVEGRSRLGRTRCWRITSKMV